MNKFQRAIADLKGGIEGGVDDIRHEYERAVWGRKTTGEVNIFPTDSPEAQPPELAGKDIDNDMDI